METDGVLILDTQQIKGIDGKMYEPAQGMVKSGDYIKAVNQKEICGKKELLKELEKLSGEKVELTVRRGGKLEKIVLQAVETAAGEYKLGIWVRDNVQGLGTVTFLTEQNEFGALGHGIHDTDTNGLMEISGGKLYRTITAIICLERSKKIPMQGFMADWIKPRSFLEKKNWLKLRQKRKS